ncbi:hypothetical protein AbraIFM66950_011157 [Aspergillus brasiliensis]|nr:hypothetical protein AbraIFM66950_011157 [Aspergillus brasiliensis]
MPNLDIPGQIGILVNNAVTGLGLTAQPEEVKADLYKLLIYEEGAFFHPHQDSEKADGMFVTLVRLGFDMYLANIEKTESDAADELYDETDEINSSLEFLQVVDSFGVDVAENLPFHETMLIQEGFFLDRDPDDEEYEGFTGNEGTETTRFYRVTGAIIIPKGFRFLFKLHRLRRGACNIAEILDECRFLALERPKTMWRSKNLVQACSTVKKKGPPGDVADKIMQIATDFDFVDLFCHAIERFDTHMSPSQLHQIAKFMAKHGFQGLRSGYV